MLTKAHVTQRLRDIKARQEAGELSPWYARILKQGVRAAYKAEARERRSARRKVQTARKKGEIERPPYCESCGSPGPVEAHHPDHNEALVVLWLCHACHAAANGKLAKRTVADPAFWVMAVGITLPQGPTLATEGLAA
jgi:hypothetical protein